MAVCESLGKVLKESISNVLESFDSVEKLGDVQTSGLPVLVNCCCFSLFRVFVYILTKWDTATIQKVQLCLLFVP